MKAITIQISNMHLNVYEGSCVPPILENILNRQLNLKVSHNIKTMDIFRNKINQTDLLADM